MTGKRLVTVICSGNICRSPMGEAFLRSHLAERGLDHIEVCSAGTHALVGHAAMGEAQRAVESIRGDASRHVAQLLDIGLARRSDLILCATGEHRRHILEYWPEFDGRVRLFNDPIAGDAPVDVDDPYGWDQEVFHLAARVIDRSMEAWADDLGRRWPA